jgi:hypothetical protein
MGDVLSTVALVAAGAWVVMFILALLIFSRHFG